jgi:hypothetical protein
MERTVVNPQYRKATYQIKKLREKKQRIEPKFTTQNLVNDYKSKINLFLLYVDTSNNVNNNVNK